MRIALLSDLHLEIAPFEAPRVDADVVVLAGDIDNGVRGIEWAAGNFDVPVLYVAGNHEYYGGDFEEVRGAIAESATARGITLLDCGEARIGKVRFLGCSLWTDYSLAEGAGRAAAIEGARRRNPDFALIRRGERTFSPEDAMALCRAHRDWLGESLAAPHDGTTVVITHFAPHRGSIAPAFAAHPANPGFIVPLDAMMGQAQLWLHGHTHAAFDYRVNGTRVVCNPRGYPDEATGFAPVRILEVSCGA